MSRKIFISVSFFYKVDGDVAKIEFFIMGGVWAPNKKNPPAHIEAGGYI